MVLSGKNESSCCSVVADKGGKVFVQDEEGPLGSVRWEEAAWVQIFVLLTEGAGCSPGAG